MSDNIIIRKNTLLGALAVVLALGGVALASSYITKERLTAETDAPPVKPAAAPKHITSNPQPRQVAAAQPRCDDGNVLGAVAGGAGGGILGSTVGSGAGKTAATIGGTLGGAYLGKQYIPLHNTTCRQ